MAESLEALREWIQHVYRNWTVHTTLHLEGPVAKAKDL